MMIQMYLVLSYEQIVLWLTPHAPDTPQSIKGRWHECICLHLRVTVMFCCDSIYFHVHFMVTSLSKIYPKCHHIYSQRWTSFKYVSMYDITYIIKNTSNNITKPSAEDEWWPCQMFQWDSSSKEQSNFFKFEKNVRSRIYQY